MKNLIFSLLVVFLVFISYQDAKTVISNCEKCHKKITPGIVKDFNKSKMSKVLTCKSCHGENHTNKKDFQKANLPTINTCKTCHSIQANQYLSGKHALGLLAITAFPDFTHKQPKAFIAGQRGCNGCHNLGIVDNNIRKTIKYKKYYKYGMDCQNCHTRHAFSIKEAKEPEACSSCHTGFDHAQWEMWFHSKHGSAYLTDRKSHRGPTCQDCHMPEGNHTVITAWGFLALRLPEADQEWLNYRLTILKALGVLDAKGNPTERLELVKAANMARLDKESWEKEREKMINVCKNCHSENFAKKNLKNADLMIKAADKIFAEAINIVKDLYKDGIIPKKSGQITWPYPDLLNFYEVYTPIEEMLYEMFMDYRMKTYQAAFHIMPDYTTWYGYAKMKKTLVKIKKEAERMRAEVKNKR